MIFIDNYYCVSKRYLRKASGRVTNIIPASQASIFHNEEDISVPHDKPRIVSTIGVTGLISANTCSHEGMVSIGTYSELAKTKGKTHTKPATWAVSTSFTEIPMKAIRGTDYISKRDIHPMI